MDNLSKAVQVAGIKSPAARSYVLRQARKALGDDASKADGVTAQASVAAILNEDRSLYVAEMKGGDLNRAVMTAKEKSAFIAQHGEDAFLNLPN